MTNDDLERDCTQLSADLFQLAAESAADPRVKVYAAVRLVAELAAATTAWRPEQGPPIRAALQAVMDGLPGLMDITRAPDDGLRH